MTKSICFRSGTTWPHQQLQHQGHTLKLTGWFYHPTLLTGPTPQRPADRNTRHATQTDQL
ncbi:MAG: hypothetical protein AAFP10_01520 [Pseudomonadota bacterium]